MFPLLVGLAAFAVAMLITLGASRSWPKTKEQPEVTVVICARNESEHLMDCLVSLSTQDYPQDRYRVVLVNHLSTDDTGELMEYFAANAPIATEVVHVREEDPVLKGKVHALEIGLSHVTTEHVLLTDGDCILPETWISTLMSYFRESVLAVGGLVTVGRQGVPDTPIARIQNVDHRYYLGMLSGLAGLRAPTVNQPHVKDSIPPVIRKFITPLRPAFCIGNNLAFRMSEYQKIGGYRKIGPSLIEDYALMNEMTRHSKKHLAVVLDPEARVFTTPETSLRGLWHQKRRWATGTGVINPLSAMLFILIILIRAVVPWFLFSQPVEALIALVLMGIGDMVVIRLVSHRTGDKVKYRDILFHEIYQIVLNILLVLAIAVRWPVFWKGQRYANPHGGKSA